MSKGKNGFKQVIEAFWKCPYCPATAKEWRRQKVTRNNARKHLSEFHREERKTNPKSPIIETRRVENLCCRCKVNPIWEVEGARELGLCEPCTDVIIEEILSYEIEEWKKVSN